MADTPHVWIPKVLTKLDYIKSRYAPGRSKGVSPGSYLADLITNKETIIMCPSCDHKFRQIYKKHGYRKIPFDCDGPCDDCRNGSINAKVYAWDDDFNYHFAPHPAGGHGKYGEWGRPQKQKWNPFKGKVTLK